MLLFRLCAASGARTFFSTSSAPFKYPSAVLLKPFTFGESSAMGLVAVSPVRGAFAETVSIRGTFACASPPGVRLGEVGIDAFADMVASTTTSAGVGVIRSVSVVVDMDKLLEDDGNFGAEKVLDTAEVIDS
jgi:hypothetical protein